MYTTKWIVFSRTIGMALRVRQDGRPAIGSESRATLFDTATEALDARRWSGLTTDSWIVTEVNVIE